MKSWADHCSSDEEDEDIPRVQVPPQVEESDSESEYSDNEEEENNNNNRGNNSGPRNNNYNRDRNPRPPPVLPTSAPFTAFVGNLSYEIQDAKHLAYELERLCQEKLQRSVTAVDGRLMTDRESGMKKGYGYIEFDTVEDLATVLELSGNVELYNRVLRIDVANAPKNQNNNRRNPNHNNQQNHHHNQRGPPHYNNNNNYNRSASNLSQASGTSEIDGSNFRGGKYNRQNSSHSTSNNNVPDKTESGGGDTVQRTRPKLNLMARTKPLEIRQDSTTSNSSIFGSGKARAEQTESGAGKDTSPASPSVTILKRENKDSSEQYFIFDFLFVQLGWTINMTLAWVLFWCYGYPVYKQYGYSSLLDPLTGATPSGPNGSGVVVVTMTLMIVMTITWVHKLVTHQVGKKDIGISSSDDDEGNEWEDTNKEN